MDASFSSTAGAWYREAAGAAARLSTRVRSGLTSSWHVPEWVWPVLLLVLVVVIWTGYFQRVSAAAWETPILHTADEKSPTSLKGDVLWGMAAAKAIASGEIGLFGEKNPLAFGAPFRGNWNDYPSSEEGISAWWALLVASFGLFRGSNLLLLSAHLLAAGSFYYVCVQLGYDRRLSIAGALLFAFSRYALWRGLPHITLTFYWHIPLALLVAWWCARGDAFERDGRKLSFCALVAVIHGVQNPYYSALFLQLLAGAGIVGALRASQWRRLLMPAGLGALTIGTMVLMNIDTFSHRAAAGANAGVMDRPYSNVEYFALKPLELLLPFSHRVGKLADWTQSSYFFKAMFVGEPGSPYLGWIGIAAVALLVWSAIQALIANEIRRVPLQFWCIAWVLAFSLVGGFNGVLALFDLSPFRASNRYSIVILAVALLFLIRQLSDWSRQRHPMFAGAAAFLMAAIGIFDQAPRRPAESEASARKMMRDDRQLVAKMEEKLPAQTMIFQLPVMPFPEAGEVKGLSDYAHFRPYLHSKDLRFSYGSNKGRSRDRWQAELEQLGPAGFVDRLERYGFGAVLVSRKGYDDGGASVVEALRLVGRSRIIARSSDFVAIELNPSRTPTLPPAFDSGWHGLEGDAARNRRWSSGDAELVLYNAEPTAKQVLVTFSLGTIQRRVIDIRSGEQSVYRALLLPHEPLQPAFLFLTLAPGRNEIRFETDEPGRLPPNGDKRELAFHVDQFEVTEL